MGVFTSRHSKGQAFVPDFMASLAIFAFILGAFLIPWNTILENQAGFDQLEEVRRETTRTTTFLVGTPGYPQDWEDTAENPRIPGFASSKNVLDGEKIYEFSKLDYETQRTLLKARNFRLEVPGPENASEEDTDLINYSMGQELPGENANVVYPESRDVLVNVSGELHRGKLKFIKWRMTG
jgi:hypothetical protein